MQWMLPSGMWRFNVLRSDIAVIAASDGIVRCLVVRSVRVTQGRR
jgi:hypothetical protein